MTVAGEPGGISSHGVDRNHRAVHFIRAAHPVPHHHRAQDVPPGALQPGPLLVAGGVGGGGVGDHHHRALLPARGVPRHPPHAQLCPCGRGRRLRLGHLQLVGERSQVVQGASVQPHPFPGWQELLPLTSFL